MTLTPQSELAAYLIAYTSERDLVPHTVDSYVHAIRAFAKHLRYAPRVEDSTAEKINALISARQVNAMSPKTVRNEQVALSALWNGAHFAVLLPTKPERVKHVKVPMGPPVAWDEHQLAALLAVASQFRGRLRTHRVPKSAFYTAFIRVGYDTGLRFSDMMELTWLQIASDGGIHVVQQKTGWPHFASQTASASSATC